jgi:hypothetical protein
MIIDESDDWHRRLLRPRCKWPRGGTAEQRDELASSHVEHGASSPASGPRRQR